ncbi:hypothetical protein BROC_00582 [Candidatus Brocadiaceae bacterium]|nr:hypothetical protein BROC_00582 [Candidatus Brocadiaceae bacterium]
MKLKTFLPALLTSLVIGLTVVGCSDDQPQPVAQKPAFDPFDHSKDEKVTKSEKEEFEKAFTDKCVKDETAANPSMDKQKFERACNCIAEYLKTNLTAKEAEKFVEEHQNPVSLTFKENAAVYHCVQENTPPKDSGFSHPTTPQQ